jgi:PAS domain S-box-containing protein
VPHPAIEPKHPSSLRQRALSRLTNASGTLASRDSASAALSVLHELASSPATAADALALLHELQVHQVEVDLQDEELRQSRAELEAELSHQIALYEQAPVGLLTVDHQALVVQLNLPAAQLLGLDRQSLTGQALTGLLAPASADALRTLMGRRRAGVSGPACTLQLVSGEASPRLVQANAHFDPATQLFALALMAV